ncbi:HAD-IG family 5'-nucleotidase [Mesoterricola silvestris]|uniref:Haloacid dehalogenase n=1 Tax=Mesoterricola silvestris TaxID=2927979 RepID=A0AA48K9P7_9BACT|nr:HAD-IG family 5'-nucleotidase [Mesoterricola silvestris]BDU73295.1 haloacid dehalogenase [Mesoterricola silvestris]
MSDADPLVIPPRGRGVFCNRTLNFRSLHAIGYDMDYTLVNYRVDIFERQVYGFARERFLEQGWPVQGLVFDQGMVARGLVIDTQTGNIVKANRFGLVRRAQHGTRPLTFSEQRAAYADTLVDLSDPRWVFLNTLFSLSEGCLYAQMVDLLDARALPEVLGYRELYVRVRDVVDAQHMEGRLKADIIAAPEACVVLDPETALTLLDQRHAGKKLLLITNSDWTFSSAMMSYSFDRFLPGGMTWRDLFDLVIVGARKPEFFTSRAPFFQVVTEDGMLRPTMGPLQPGVAYMGGSAAQVEKDLGMSGDEILYVGDHMFGDVHMSKSEFRWRTALILRELEAEVEALESFAGAERIIASKMEEKERLEAQFSQTRLELQRLREGYGPRGQVPAADLETRLQELRNRLTPLDLEIAPLARAATELTNDRWGLLTRAGNDKSHLARQVERYADVYTSRVSNFLYATPFVFLRSPRGSLPHDPTSPGGTSTLPPSEGIADA